MFFVYCVCMSFSPIYAINKHLYCVIVNVSKRVRSLWYNLLHGHCRLLICHWIRDQFLAAFVLVYTTMQWLCSDWPKLIVPRGKTDSTGLNLVGMETLWSSLSVVHDLN